jgi:hypothetical protein
MHFNQEETSKVNLSTFFYIYCMPGLHYINIIKLHGEGRKEERTMMATDYAHVTKIRAIH